MIPVTMPPMNSTDRYLDLLKGCLTRSLFLDEQRQEVHLAGWRWYLWKAFKRLEKGYNWRIVGPRPVVVANREEGRDWPQNGETMIGKARLDNLQACVTQVLEDDVPGDLLEAGVWRGGASILMRAVLAVYGSDRAVWLADSFEGLPPPDTERFPQDAGLDFSQFPALKVGVEQVKANFAKYGLLDDQVRFLPGWFKDTLPSAPIEQLALIRLDGDLYESTIDSIAALYPKLSVGGFLIVDDYNNPGWAKAAGQAIRDYREEHGITEPIQEIDWTGVYWRRER
jgi:O-methyltransferase